MISSSRRSGRRKRSSGRRWRWVHELTDRGGSSLRVFARLKPGVTLQQAQAEMTAITSRLEREFPGTNQDMQVLSLREKVVGNIRPALLVLLGAVGFVLLIACANVSHMLLARAAARREEIALRTALGAGRWDMFRQLLTESLVLASMGGSAGLLLAVWGVRALVALGPADIPRVETIGVDGHVLLFAVGISLLTGLAFGMVPAWRATAVNLSDAALSRLMAGLLYGTRVTDPTTFVAAVLVLCVVAVAASYIPARRAIKVDPMVALRYE